MQEKRPEEVEVLQKKHPLLEIKYFPTLTWPKFLEKWQNPDLELELRLSLLHYGFGLKMEGVEQKERLFFYFDLADGFDSGYQSFRNREESEIISRDTWIVRKELAKKAFQMLCLHFFKNKTEKRLRLSWAQDVFYHEDVLKKVLWFSRSDGDSLVNPIYSNYCGVGNHYLELAQKFLEDFVWFVWYGFEAQLNERGNPAFPKNCINTEWFLDARSKIVQILYSTQRIHRMISLTKEALGSEGAVAETREEVLDELGELATGGHKIDLVKATAGCNPAAEVLAVLKARKNAREHLEIFA